MMRPFVAASRRPLVWRDIFAGSRFRDPSRHRGCGVPKSETSIKGGACWLLAFRTVLWGSQDPKIPKKTGHPWLPGFKYTMWGMVSTTHTRTAKIIQNEDPQPRDEIRQLLCGDRPGAETLMPVSVVPGHKLQGSNPTSFQSSSSDWI